jgi:hypothetical protein
MLMIMKSPMPTIVIIINNHNFHHHYHGYKDDGDNDDDENRDNHDDFETRSFILKYALVFFRSQASADYALFVHCGVQPRDATARCTRCSARRHTQQALASNRCHVTAACVA